MMRKDFSIQRCDAVRVRTVFVIFAVVLGLCCAVPASSQAVEREQALRQRVQDRWQAMLARDYDRVYAFHTPMYRELFTGEYVARKLRAAMPASDANLVLIEFADDSEVGNPRSATAVVNVHYQVPVPFSTGLQETINTYREQWLWLEGEWWFVPGP